MKKTLVIHPQDNTTDFLEVIYKDINNKTVVNGGVSKKELIKMIDSHDRIIMMGHGTPAGLFSIGQWGEGFNGYIIDISMIETLKKKKDCYYIWCNADKFVDYWELNGFYTGMFISEVSEASWYRIFVKQNVVNESNNEFSKILSNYIKRPLKQTYKKVLQEYGELVETNPVASYNHERLYIRE